MLLHLPTIDHNSVEIIFEVLFNFFRKNLWGIDVFSPLFATKKTFELSVCTDFWHFNNIGMHPMFFETSVITC